MAKSVYTDSEFWKENPICETSDGVYSINGICYRQKSDGKWHRV